MAERRLCLGPAQCNKLHSTICIVLLSEFFLPEQVTTTVIGAPNQGGDLRGLWPHPASAPLISVHGPCQGPFGGASGALVGLQTSTVILYRTPHGHCFPSGGREAPSDNKTPKLWLLLSFYIFTNLLFIPPLVGRQASQVALAVKTLPATAGDVRDLGFIPRSGRSPGGGHGNPLQYSCLENPTDRKAWQAMVHGVTASDMTEAT